MANRNIHVDITASDNASSVFQRVRSSASSMSSTLMNTLGGAVGSVGRLDNTLRNYNSSMYRFNSVVSSVVRTAGDSIYNFTKDAINNFSALEQQHAKTMGAMATDYDKTAVAQRKFLDDSEKLKQQALKLGTVGPTGRGSLNNPLDVSYAQTALVKSGLSADDILKSNAVESILKFAGGNDLDIDTATTFAVNLGTVFDKPVEEWGKMLDMVTKAADISVIDVEDIMDSLTYTGGIASGLGRDLDEVLGVISVMGQAGLRGRVAGTGLQAFFTRILSAGELSDTQIGNAPTEYVGQMYNAFTAEAVNTDGSFKNMDEVAELLNTAMEGLNDQEQAWFAKKLFGLYQMKAAYALTGSVNGDENLITDFINQIENQSEGANDIKYDLMLASQYGKIESLRNAWTGIETDFGDRLSPVVSVVADELFNFLSNNGNYEINWDNLREAISESGELIGEKYGEELGNAIEEFGNFGINSALITETQLPLAGGIISGIGKLLNGDISGAIDEFERGLEDTNNEISDLPPELRGSAEAARNVIIAFTALSGINLATQITQIITTAFNTFVAKPIGWIKSLIAGKTTTTTIGSSANTVVNANYVQVNTSTTSVQAGTATAVNIGQLPLMNVTATVVNVYGGNGIPNTNPNTPLPGLPGGNPLPSLPSGGSPWLLPGGAALGYGASKLPQLFSGGGGNIAGALPAAGAGAGDAIKMVYNPLTKSYMTKTALAKSIGATALKGAGIIGEVALVLSLGGSENQGIKTYNNNLGNVDKDSEDYKRYQDEWDNRSWWQYIFTPAHPEEKWRDNIKNATPEDYRNERDKIFGSTTESDVHGLIYANIDRWFYDNYSGNENFISKDQYIALVAALAEHIKANGDSSNARGFLDGQTQYLNTSYGGIAINAGMVMGSKSFGNNAGTTMSVVDNVIDTANTIIGEANNAIKRIENPIITVNVTTNVDKSGNAVSNVNINSIARDISRRASQYGYMGMMVTDR